jgi:hypothetical protein
MRKFLLGLFCAGLIGASPALATNNDIIELGVGLRYLFDGNTFAADNSAVNPELDTMPLAGDYSLGFGFHAACGHRFDSRRLPWEFRLRYDFYMAPKDSGLRTIGGISGVSETHLITGSLYEHDVFMSFRFHDLLPIQFDGLYYELGVGAVTLTYDYTRELFDGMSLTPIESKNKTRSGLGVLLGAGYLHDLGDDAYVSASAELVFSQIQDGKDASGGIVHASPNANGLHLRLTYGRYFTSLF